MADHAVNGNAMNGQFGQANVPPTESNYETSKYLSEYLCFHYGTVTEILGEWTLIGPAQNLFFPKRCAQLCLKHMKLQDERTLPRALDIGCAVGRSTFELARGFEEVIGIDYSHSFASVCSELQKKGKFDYTVVMEGEITQPRTAVVDPTIKRSRVKFQQGDACLLDAEELGGLFDCVLAANLLDRLHTPTDCLSKLPGLIKPGGFLVMVDPYTFLLEYTSRKKWVGGFIKEGKPYSGFDGLQDHLNPLFDLVAEENLPYVIRETEREYQWAVSHATIWRRK